MKKTVLVLSLWLSSASMLVPAAAENLLQTIDSEFYYPQYAAKNGFSMAIIYKHRQLAF